MWRKGCSTDGFPLFSPGQHGKDDVSNPKNQAERAPILLSRAWSGLDTSFPRWPKRKSSQRPAGNEHRRGCQAHGIVFFCGPKKTHVRQQPMFFSFVTRSFVFILPSRWSGSRIPANQREERKTKVKS